MKHIFLSLALAAGTVMTAAAQLSFTTLNSGTAESLRGISFADTLTGYACGDNGTFLKTTNGGAVWTTLAVPGASDLWDVKVIPSSGGQKVIVVGANSTILKSVNGGSTWTAQTVPFAPGSFVFGVQCLDSQNYVACGGDFTTNTGAVLKTTNGGATWTKTSVPGTLFLDKIFMLNGTTGFTAGTGAAFTDGSIQKATGASWSAVKTSSNIITNVWCHSTTSAVAVGLGGQIWRSTDGGTTWASKSVNAFDLYGIAFRDGKRGYACGGPAALVLSTTDSGNTWTPESYTGNDALNSISIVGNRLFIAGDGGVILKSVLSSGGVGVAESSPSTPDVRVHPNPATELLVVSNDAHRAGLRFCLVNQYGQTVADEAVPGNGLKLPVGRFAKGCYNYVVKEEGRSVTAGTLLLR